MERNFGIVAPYMYVYMVLLLQLTCSSVRESWKASKYIAAAPTFFGNSMDLQVGQVTWAWSTQLSRHFRWNTWEQLHGSLTSSLPSIQSKQTGHMLSWSSSSFPDLSSKLLYAITLSFFLISLARVETGTGIGDGQSSSIKRT